MPKKTLTQETSYYTFLFFNFLEKTKTYRKQALCYALLLVSVLFFTWHLFFKEPSVDLYLQAKKEYFLLQKSLLDENNSAIEAHTLSLLPLLEKEPSLLQRYGFSTLQLLLIAEKQQEAEKLYRILTQTVPAPSLKTTALFRDTQIALQETQEGSSLDTFLEEKDASPTAKSLARLEQELLGVQKEDKQDHLLPLAPYFSEGSATLQDFLKRKSL